MTKIKYLIIGGGIAGTNAAEEIRKNDAEGSIAIISDEPHKVYSRITLPNYLKGTTARERLFLRPEDFYTKNKIDFLGKVSAQSVDTKAKEVKLSNGDTVSYSKLLIATGGRPRPYPLKDKVKTGIFNFQTLEDSDAIIERMKTTKNAMIVGGGFIGLELATVFSHRKIPASFLIREPYFWGTLLDKEGGELIQKLLNENNVTVLPNEEVVDVEGNSDGLQTVLTKSGKRLPSELMGVGIGILLNTEFLKDSGIQVNRGIVANEYLETSAPDVWTAGDIGEFYDVLVEKRLCLGNWINAQEQGKCAGLNMAGKKTEFRNVSSYSVSMFRFSVAFIGDVMPTPDTKILVRDLRTTAGAYVRIHVRGGRIVGATVLNSLKDSLPLKKLFQAKVNVSGKEDVLCDPASDLGKLASELIQ